MGSRKCLTKIVNHPRKHDDCGGSWRHGSTQCSSLGLGKRGDTCDSREHEHVECLSSYEHFSSPFDSNIRHPDINSTTKQNGTKRKLRPPLASLSIIPSTHRQTTMNHPNRIVLNMSNDQHTNSRQGQEDSSGDRKGEVREKPLSARRPRQYESWEELEWTHRAG